MKKEPPKRGPGRPATGTALKRYFRMDDESWESIQAWRRSGRRDRIGLYTRHDVEGRQ